jgi:DNA-binding transcriptional regulator LsrR (DeoR family)
MLIRQMPIHYTVGMAQTDYQRLLIKISRLYYEDELTQADIGERLRLSRQKVQRLLRDAKSHGIVQIGIKPIIGIYGDLEKALERQFRLQEAVVVETSDYHSQQTAAREVGAGAAEYLARVLRSGDRIVMSWGGSLLAMVNALAYAGLTDHERVTIIQGLGGIADPNNEVHATELVRRLARALRGQAILLPAPGIAASRSARDAFYADPYIEDVFKAACSANLAFMGIGTPRQDSILIQEGRIATWPALQTLVDAGAVGDLNLRFFNSKGEGVPSEIDTRVIGLGLDQIRGIDRVVGVAGGAVKLNSIRGALAGRLIDVLVTDHLTAKHLLEDDSAK